MGYLERNSGPQWYYKWLQSADNSTDGDTRYDLPWMRGVDNAAAALCLDYLRRHGKGNWIRDELYWNYLFSNKNCARVWSVLFGIASPLGYLSLCLGHVGFLCTYFLILQMATPSLPTKPRANGYKQKAA